MAHYESDITRFLRELKARDPALEQRQRAARATWWDRPRDEEQLAQWRAARVAQQPYVYQSR